MNKFEAFIRWSIFGDGNLSINKSARCKNSKYAIVRNLEHGDYINYIANKFKTLSDIKPIIDVIYFKDVGYFRFVLCTHTNKLLTKIYYSQYYDLQIGKKGKTRKLHIPMLDTLTPEYLALLYMDDGCYSKRTNHNSYLLEISTYSYTYNEQRLLVDTIKDKFNIEFNIIYHKNRDIYYLTLPSKYHQDFFDLVSPYIVPSYQYKLPAKYRIKEA